MKLSIYLVVLIMISGCCSAVKAQEFNLTKFIDEAQSVARKTAYQNYFEFTYDFKRTGEKKNGKKFSDAHESVCSKKRCEYIFVEKDGKPLSEKVIRKNREKASKRLEKAEALPENKYLAGKELPVGYGFMISTSFSSNYSNFNPSLYLKNCQVSFVKNVSIENRPTVLLRADDCNVDKEGSKDALQFMPQTEAAIWIDEQDKAIAKTEVYYKNKADISLTASAKPVVAMKAERIREGFWFWKLISIDSSANESFFPKDYGNWQIELYNYKPYTVVVEKVEIDGK